MPLDLFHLVLACVFLAVWAFVAYLTVACRPTVRRLELGLDSERSLVGGRELRLDAADRPGETLHGATSGMTQPGEPARQLPGRPD